MTREQVQGWLGQRFSNLFVLEFDGDGRCSAFTEWFMEHPM